MWVGGTMYLIMYTTVAYLSSSPPNGGDDLYYPVKSKGQLLGFCPTTHVQAWYSVLRKVC